MSRIALIDGDALVYKAGFASEVSSYDVYYKGRKIKNCRRKSEIKYGTAAINQEPYDTATAFNNVDKLLNFILKRTKASSYRIYLTDSDPRNNTRCSIDPSYKAARSKKTRPMHYNNIREYLIGKYGAEVVTGIEADDQLGIEQTEDTIIVSHDKDLLMIPGKHFSLTHNKFVKSDDPGRLQLYSDKGGKKRLLGYGFKWFCAQMLMGDEADNIKGLRRVGPVKATKLLAELNDPRKMLSAVLNEYTKQDMLHEFDINCRLLWICRKDMPYAYDYLETL